MPARASQSFALVHKENQTMHSHLKRSLPRSLAIFGAVTLLVPAAASAHARISPAVSVKGELQLYSLAVPTEKENAVTTKIVLTVPNGFSIDSFAPSPGWTRVLQQTGSGDTAVIQKVTWTGGHIPTGEDSLFQFLAQPASSQTYKFAVQQTYSDGSIVNWTGSESSESPAPTITVKDSLGGGGGSLLAIIALILAVLAVLAAGLSLVGGGRGGGRPLA
jgi:uncharacterized protein YcnI